MTFEEYERCQSRTTSFQYLLRKKRSKQQLQDNLEGKPTLQALQILGSNMDSEHTVYA